MLWRYENTFLGAMKTIINTHACFLVLIYAHWRLTRKRSHSIKSFSVVFAHKNDSRSFIKLRLNHWCHMDYCNDVLDAFLGLERAGCVAVYRGQRTLRFHQKYLNLCSEEERRSDRFRTAWGRVINDIIFISRVNYPLKCPLIRWQCTLLNPGLLCFYKSNIVEYNAE